MQEEGKILHKTEKEKKRVKSGGQKKKTRCYNRAHETPGLFSRGQDSINLTCRCVGEQKTARTNIKTTTVVFQAMA